MMTGNGYFYAWRTQSDSKMNTDRVKSSHSLSPKLLKGKSKRINAIKEDEPSLIHCEPPVRYVRLRTRAITL